MSYALLYSPELLKQYQLLGSCVFETPFINWKIGQLDPSRHDSHLNFFNTHCICTGYTDNKENQIFTYIRKFRMEQLQSHD
jgi:hypothetical protein